MPPKNPYFGEGSVVVSADGEGAVRRLAIKKDALVERPFEGIDVIPDVIDYAARGYGNRPAMGWRTIVNIHEEEKEVQKTVGGQQVTEKKKWKYFELSGFEYIDFLEVQKRVRELSRGLLHYGIRKGDVFNIYAQTRSASCFVLLLGGRFCHVGTDVASQYELAAHVTCLHNHRNTCCNGL